MYDLRNKEIRNMLKGFIEQDIKEISRLLNKLIIPMKLSKRRQGLRMGSTCGKRKLRSSECINLDAKEALREIADVKPLVLCRSQKLSGIIARSKGGDNLAKFSKISRKTDMDKETICVKAKAVEKNLYNNLETFDRYSYISEILK